MTKYSFVLLSSRTEEFLKELQELGLVDITRSSRPVDDRSVELLSQIENAKVEIKDIKEGSDAHLRELRTALAAQLRDYADIKVWGSWDREKLAELGLAYHFYKIDARKFSPELGEQFPIRVVKEEKKYVYLVLVGDPGDFPFKELNPPSLTAAEAAAAIDDRQREISLYEKALTDRRSELPALERALASTKEELSRYLAALSGESAAENTLAVFEGFAPVEDAAALEARFDGMDLLWLKEQATETDNPPIKLRNKKFAGMFEVLTDMYGRPGYDGFDPTPFISIFFTLFFAFCMGDAGYGLVLLLIGFLLRKKLGKTASLVMVLGTATVVVGFFFHSFFSMDISKWGFIRSLGLNRIMMPSDSQCVVQGLGSYDWNMILALACGVLHISLAQVTKAIVATRNKGFFNSLGVWGWTLLIVGGVTIGVLAILKVFDSSVTKIAIIAVGIVSGLFIFFLRDLHKNPLANFGNGLWESYNTATGLLSDVLSYLRLYALALAGSLLGGAFNDLAVMVRGDGGIGGWIFFVLLLVVGHVLNIAMSGLSAFVHPLRLNFLEFFKNAGYEGTGRNYAPLSKEQ
ncbi:MAG: hypothetical protein K6G39_07365 [Bacteroidales bacterium]|nr:hypothetical protein [Bacteroidales bacterium]